jgi:hypothetical protein
MPPPIMYENDDAAAWRRADAEYWTERFLGSGYTADLTAWLKSNARPRLTKNMKPPERAVGQVLGARAFPRAG